MNLIEKIMAFMKGKGLPENADEKLVDEFTGKFKTIEDCDLAYQTGLDAGKLEGIKQGKSELQIQYEEILVKLATVEADKVTLTAELETQKAKNAKLAGGLNAPSEETVLLGRVGFETAVNELMKTGMKREDAQIQIQRQNPILFKSFIDEANRKK